ncbi:MAG: DNA helicase II / ATP-dependent DNA helicase PcrA [Parcubacteria bacterium C7867-006]|nr:MAG: DNA helicase II / ATP-dependent DNA helicase PcrA [Parcubacteria bacterium C7867-006]
MSNAIFEERYKRLNKAQKEAVDTIEGPVMVIAGPGTGKTTILTLRIANILNKTDTPASGILALTFTDAGVKAMRMKLREIIGNRADEVRLHTFHGFASSVIAEFPEHFPHLSRAKQITDVEAESILREILKNKKYSKLRPLGETDFYLNKIISAIGDAKKEAWTPDTVREFAKAEIERVNADPDAISSRGATKGSLKADALKRIERCERTVIFADVYNEYEAKKREERKIDFDDLLFELLSALRSDELLLRLLQEKFLYILVDEHQDTNDAQNLIVALLANFFDNPNVFVVGDEKQAIYRFQGASVENFLKFQNIWKDMKVISLEENYRSHQDILDATYSMIEENYDDGQYKDLRIKLKSGSKEKNKPIDLVYAEDAGSSDHFLVNELLKITENDPEATVAVILRWNRDVDYVLSLCEANGIKASAERGADVFASPIGVLYFKILEYLNDPSKTEALAETIAGGLWGLDFAKSNELIKKIRSGNIKDIEKEIPELIELKNEQNKSGVIEYLIMIGELSFLTKAEKLTSPMQVEIWRAIIDLGRELAVNSHIENPSNLIKQLLDYQKTAENKTIKIGSGRNDAKIQVMTAHSSKGLEYDYVFLPYALEEYWMRRPRSSVFVMPRDKDTSDEVRDSRRLFYVALTRAKKHAVVMVPAQDNLGKDFTPLRFIDEMHKDSVSRIDSPKTDLPPKALNRTELKSHRKSEIVEYTKRVLLKNGLSVTALNHFLVCPSQFLYKSILKVPEAPSPSSEKGIAMHKAISDVWKNKDKTVKDITKTIKNSVTEYFNSSLLPKSEKEIILEELTANAPVVASALQEHFAIDGIVFTDKWIESNFTTDLGELKTIVLHGQMDTIIDTDKKTFVFDYKTRESMSVNAIKGDTKDSDGNYFRQLVFYKMLLSGNYQYKEKAIEPALVFVKPDDKGRCPTITLPIDYGDEEKVRSEITRLVQSVFSGDFMTETCDDKSCQYCGYKKLI